MNNYNLSNVLKQNGLKNTKHRIAILDILQKSSQPVSAEQLFQKMLKKNMSINLSTVYRILDTLYDKNLVIKLIIAGYDSTLFAFDHMVHRHYLICLDCKKILAIERCPLKGYEKILSKETNFSITGHKLSIYGYCPACQENSRMEDKGE